MRNKRKIALILIYISFLLILFEGSSRLFLSIKPIARRIRITEDLTWHRKWVSRHQNGIEIYYKFDIYDRSKGWISKPNLRNMPVFEDKILNTNSSGLRGAKDYSYGKHPTNMRIVILGDSFTFGDGVSDTETYSYYLQQMIPTVEVINMGVHGYGHDQMLILFMEEGLKYQPDIVILGFVYADTYRNVLRFRDYAKPKFVFDNGELKVTNSPVPSPEDVLKWDWVRPRVYDIWSIIAFGLESPFGWHKEERDRLTEHILDQMVETIDKIDGIPIIVYLPQQDEIYDPSEVLEDEKFLFSYCQTNDKVHCFSSCPYFAEKIRQGESFKSKGHWNPIGHLTVAEAINDYLVTNNFIDRSKLSSDSSK